MAKREKTSFSPYVHGLLCDSVRQEIGGTWTYVGVLGAGIIWEASFPCIISRLDAVVWIGVPADHETPDFCTRVILPGGATISGPKSLGSHKKRQKEADSTKSVTGFVMNLANLVIPETGRVKVIVDMLGREYLATSLYITKTSNPQPNVSE